MRVLLCTLLLTAAWVSGASGCRNLKKEYPSYKIRLRPLRSSNGTTNKPSVLLVQSLQALFVPSSKNNHFNACVSGTCALDRTCCDEEVERVVRDESLEKMRRAVQREVDNARSSINFVKAQAEGKVPDI